LKSKKGDDSLSVNSLNPPFMGRDLMLARSSL
jgi:hypothetical protein